MGIEPMTAPDLPTLRSILARLEAATGPDWRIDEDIVCALRWTPNDGYYETFPQLTYEPRKSTSHGSVQVRIGEGHVGRFDCPKFTSSLDAAVLLFNRYLPGSPWEARGSTLQSGNDWAMFCDDDPNVYTDDHRLGRPGPIEYRVIAPSAIALCTALVKALIARAEIAGLTDREKETDHD